MKSLPLVLGVLGILSACSVDPSPHSQSQSIASNLSDKDGRLAQSFLYLAEGDSIRQRECQVALPQGAQDCAKLRSTKKLVDFRRELDVDIELSRNRVAQSLGSLVRDRDGLNQQISSLTSQIQILQQQISQGSSNPSGEDPAQLKAALNFAESEREKLRQQLQATRDPSKIAELQSILAAFDQQIAALKARIAAAQGGDSSTLKKQLEQVQAALIQANRDANALNAKIRDANEQKNVIAEETRILVPTLDKLKQALVFDARDAAFNASKADKQLASRFHKLFQVNGADCTTPSIDSFKELAIGEARVFTSREAQVGGSWHIGEIVRQLLGGNPSPTQVEAFFRSWFQNWQTQFSLSSGDAAAARPDIGLVLDDWKQASAARGVNGLDLRIAPFRLIGITNRMDLRNPLVAGDAGEARLAFALLNQTTDQPQDTNVSAQAFTLIFEYKVAVGNDGELSRWAGLWHELKDLPCNSSGCDSYVSRLAQITRMFTHRNPSGFVKGQLGQARTNEIAFGNPWEQREFNLQPPEGAGNARLVQVHAKKTPKQSVNNSAELNRFVSSLSLDSIVKNNYEIPVSMRGAKAQVLGGGPEWRINGDAEKARAFNLNTCNGCHSNDEQIIDGFYHISPFQALGQAAMSPFLKQVELPKRARLLASFLVAPSCVRGTPKDARLASDAERMLNRSVH